MMESALDRADQVMIEGRQRVRDLRYENIRPEHLSDALHEIGVELALGGSARFEIRTLGLPKKLHPVVQEELYLIGKEAISNAIKHSMGTSVLCELIFTEKQFTMRIQDDGTGFDAQVLDQGRPGHWGLQGMRERTEHLSGSFSIGSSDPVGARVEISISSRSAYATPDRKHWYFPNMLANIWKRK